MGLSLEEEIERLREKMVCIAMKEGLESTQTIELSKKLDALLNQYDKNERQGQLS